MTRTVAKVEVKNQLEQKLAEGKEISKELIESNRRRTEPAAGDSEQSYGEDEEEEEEEEDTVDEAPSIVDEISAKGHKGHKLSIQGAAMPVHSFKWPCTE